MKLLANLIKIRIRVISL